MCSLNGFAIFYISDTSLNSYIFVHPLVWYAYVFITEAQSFLSFWYAFLLKETVRSTQYFDLACIITDFWTLWGFYFVFEEMVSCCIVYVVFGFQLNLASHVNRISWIYIDNFPSMYGGWFFKAWPLRFRQHTKLFFYQQSKHASLQIGTHSYFLHLLKTNTKNRLSFRWIHHFKIWLN